MAKQHELMERAIKNELKRPKRSFNDSPTTVLARVALGVIYMYLILISYELLGISGPVFVSVLFLVSFFVPLGYRILTERLQKPSATEQQRTAAEEARQDA